MDQDFHYYGTYYAAKAGGFDTAQANLIAKAANFIDFFSQTTYAAKWSLVSETAKSDNYTEVARMECPRYTFQGGLISPGASPEDGLWCSYHFTPGNFEPPTGTPTRENIHGSALANFLPQTVIRNTDGGRVELDKSGKGKYDADLRQGWMLNRPLSPLSRRMIADTLQCVTDNNRLAKILECAEGGSYLLQNNRDANLARFKLILLGVRAHVLADTWAHQDFCGLSNVLNTYWDVKYDPSSWNPSKWGLGRQSINYDDGTTNGWKNQVLSCSAKLGVWSSSNLEAAPNGTSYLGHGWMGHFPDFSFAKFQYKPCWSNPANAPIERNNPEQYKFAWLEMVSLFSQANNPQNKVDPTNTNFQTTWLNPAIKAIQAPCSLAGQTPGRAISAAAWKTQFPNNLPQEVDVVEEPHANTVLPGLLDATTRPDRYGTHVVSVSSDLYLFQIAADYHFHFVKTYLACKKGYYFSGSWSQQTSALSPTDLAPLFWTI